MNDATPSAPHPQAPRPPCRVPNFVAIQQAYSDELESTLWKIRAALLAAHVEPPAREAMLNDVRRLILVGVECGRIKSRARSNATTHGTAATCLDQAAGLAKTLEARAHLIADVDVRRCLCSLLSGAATLAVTYGTTQVLTFPRGWRPSPAFVNRLRCLVSEDMQRALRDPDWYDTMLCEPPPEAQEPT